MSEPAPTATSKPDWVRWATLGAALGALILGAVAVVLLAATADSIQETHTRIDAQEERLASIESSVAILSREPTTVIPVEGSDDSDDQNSGVRHGIGRPGTPGNPITMNVQIRRLWDESGEWETVMMEVLPEGNASFEIVSFEIDPDSITVISPTLEQAFAPDPVTFGLLFDRFAMNDDHDGIDTWWWMMTLEGQVTRLEEIVGD